VSLFQQFRCLLAAVAIYGDCSVTAVWLRLCASMPMIIMEYVSLSWVAPTGRSAYPNRGDATLLLSQVGRSSWCRPAAKQT
jgi:predicted membrane-bound mannosyltransferase